jgi:hypothetical protein
MENKELNKLNEEYISVLKEMRNLNKRRVEIMREFKKINSDVKLVIMNTVSIYHDLFGNDLDEK